MGKPEAPSGGSVLRRPAVAAARGARIRPEAGATRAVATARGHRFRDEEKLRAAVREQAASEWRAVAGRDLSDHDAANFADREPAEHEQRAAAVSAKLLAALTDVTAFAADYRRVVQNQMIVGPGPALLDPRETHRTRRLLRVVEEWLPDLDPRVQDENGKVVGPRLLVDKDGGGKIDRIEPPRPRRPGWFGFLEPDPRCASPGGHPRRLFLDGGDDGVAMLGRDGSARASPRHRHEPRLV